MLFNQWKQYFQQNKSHFTHIDIDRPDVLTEKEKKLISSSLQQFQRGEHSEGKHLFAFAEKFGDADYLECIRLFIPEEQRHAMVLSAYMRKNGIPLLRGHWVDNVFRKLRKLAGIENTVRVLLVAEIIAKVYYRALCRATSSALLQDICIQILQDEDQHIRFQCDALRFFQQRKTLAGKLLVSIWQLALMTGTILIVWWYHRKVLYKGGYSFSGFMKETLSVYFEAEKYVQKQEKRQFGFGQ
jgi:hypothetical protein